MNLELTLEQKMIQKMVREFTENEVKPIAAETDRTAQYPAETIDQLFRYGIMGMCVPKEYGGAGADVLSAAIAVEELSKHCASTGDIVATHNGLCCDPIMANGTEEQKKKYLPMLTTGRHVGAFALTEPNAGSDASKGQTVARLEGDHYVLNGSKIFTVGKHEVKMGLHGSPTAEIVFQDCIVPKENLLGQEGKGFKIAMQTLDGGRIGIAAQALGIAEGAMNEAIDYTKARADQQIPEYTVRARGHGSGLRSRQAFDLSGSREEAERRTLYQGSSDRKALLLRTRKQDCDQGTAGTWRLWLHQ